MAKKSKLIKNLLTTASAVAVIATGAQSAMGAAVFAIPEGNNRDFGAGANFTTGQADGTAAAANQAFANNMNFINISTTVAASTVMTQTNGKTINSINVAGTGFTLAVSNGANIVLGSVFNDKANGATIANQIHAGGGLAAGAGDGAAPKVAITLANGAATTLTLNGKTAAPYANTTTNNYDNLGTVDLKDNGAKVIIDLTNNGATGDKSVTFTNKFDTTQPAINGGKIDIADSNKVTFNGKIGETNTLQEIKLVGAGSVATFGADFKVADLHLGGVASTVNIAGAAPVTFTGATSNGGANGATLNVKQTFKTTGVTTVNGGTRFQNIIIGDAAASEFEITTAGNIGITNQGAGGADGIRFGHADSVLKFVGGGNHTITIANATIGGRDAAGTADADLRGKVVIDHVNNAVTIDGGLAANTFGKDGFRLKEFNTLSSGVAGSVILAKNLFAKDVNVGAASTLKVGAAELKTVKANATDSAITLTTATSVLELTAANSKVESDQVKFMDAASKLKFSHDGKVTADLVSNVPAGGGVIQVPAANTGTIIGSVGSGTAKMANIDFGNAGSKLDVTGPGVWSAGIDPIANGGKLIVRSVDSDIANSFKLAIDTVTTGNLGELNIEQSAANGASVVRVDKTFAANGVNATTFENTQNHRLLISEDINFKSANTTFNLAGQSLEFLSNDINKPSTLAGKVSANAANNGTIVVSGFGRVVSGGAANQTIGNTGGGGFGVNEIRFDTADRSLRVESTANAGGVHANNINFNKTGTSLILGNAGANQDYAVKGKINIDDAAAGADGLGTIRFDANVTNKTLTLDGKIGDLVQTKQRLQLIDLGNGQQSLVLTGGDQHIHAIQLAGDNVVKLNAHKYLIHNINNQGGVNKGQIELAGNATLTLFGSSSQLASFDIATKKATIGGNSNINAAVFKNTGGGAAGQNLIFNGAGDSMTTFNATTAAADVSRPYDIVLDGDKGARVIFPANRLDAKNNIIFNKDSILEFRGTVLEAKAFTKGAAATEGTIVLNNDSADQTVTPTAAGGLTNTVKMVVKGGNINVGANAANPKFEFDVNPNGEGNIEPKEIRFGTADIFGVGTSITISDDNVNEDNPIHHVITTTQNDKAYKGTYGAGRPLIIRGADNTVKSFKLETTGAGGARFEVNSAVNDGILKITKDDANFAEIGTSTREFSQLLFENNALMSGEDGFVQKIEVNNNQTATFSRARLPVTTEIKLNDDGAVIFNRDGFDDFAGTIIQGNTADMGTVTYGNISGKVRGQIGSSDKPLKNVNFNTAKPADGETAKQLELQKDVFSKNITFKDGLFKVNASEVNLHAKNGGVTLNGSTLDIGKNKVVTNEGKLTLNGATLRVEYVGQNNSGSLVNTLGSLTASDLKIEVKNLTDLLDAVGNTITVFDNQSADSITPAVRTVLEGAVAESSNTLVKWVPSVTDNGKITLTATDNAKTALENAAKNLSGSEASAAAIGNAEKAVRAKAGTGLRTLATNFVNDLPGLIQSLDDATESAADNGVSAATIQGISNVDAALAGIQARLNQAGGVISPDVRTTDAGAVSGVAAGEGHERFGVWASPFYTYAQQDKKNQVSGHKAESFGISAGFDTLANDDLLVGGAFSYVNNEVKHKNDRKGDKTTIDSLVFTVYGLQQLTTNWFLQGTASVANNETSLKSIRKISPTATDVAKGRFDSMSFNAEMLAGYNFAMDGFNVIPMAGVRFTRLNDGSYKETGSILKLDVNKKASNKFEGIAGLRVAGTAYDVQGVTISPEVHGFIRHDFVNKNSDLEIRADGELLNSRNIKPARTSGNVGVGVEARYGMMEYGAGYDATFASKYIAHSGTLKVRVNF